MRVSAVLLDIDDTLLDFHAGARESILRGFAAFGLPYSEAVFETFLRINEGLWREIEAGRLTRPGLHAIRWMRIFDALGIEADGPAFETVFRQGINESAIPVPGARELLAYAKEKYPVYLASNADYAQQERRLAKADLLRYVDGMFVSDRIGCAKPAPAFFDACVDGVGVPAERILMIGDSYAADISGAAARGMRTCLFAPRGIPAFDGAVPDLVVTELARVMESI